MKKIYSMFFVFAVFSFVCTSCTHSKTDKNNSSAKDNGSKENEPNTTAPRLISITVNGDERKDPGLEIDFYTVGNSVSSVKVSFKAEEGAVPTLPPELTGPELDTWQLSEGQNSFSLTLTKNNLQATYTVKLYRMPLNATTLELTRLEVGNTKFNDLSTSKLLNAESVANDIEKVKVIAEASEGINIEFTPQLQEGFWDWLKVGQNILSIRLTKENEVPQVYTVNLLRRATENGKIFNHLEKIYTSTAEFGNAWDTDFKTYKETLIEKNGEVKNCILEAIHPEDYIGFIFILDGAEIEKVEQKSMKAYAYEKMYATKDKVVTKNTTIPYRVYYFTKYSFSKQHSETATVKITYKDGKEDEFVVKAKQGVITE